MSSVLPVWHHLSTDLTLWQNTLHFQGKHPNCFSRLEESKLARGLL